MRLDGEEDKLKVGIAMACVGPSLGDIVVRGSGAIHRHVRTTVHFFSNDAKRSCFCYWVFVRYNTSQQVFSPASEDFEKSANPSFPTPKLISFARDCMISSPRVHHVALLLHEWHFQATCTRAEAKGAITSLFQGTPRHTMSFHAILLKTLFILSNTFH